MVNTFERTLNLPFTVDITVDESMTRSTRYCHDLSVLANWLSSLNLEITRAGAELFYIAPNQSIPIHSDGTRTDNKVKLNFQYRGAGSVMNWYRAKNSTESSSDNPIQFGPYAQLDDSNAELVHCAKIGYPSLVNAGVFHNVENALDHRWTLSVPVWNLDTMSNLQWDDAIAKFSPWIVQ
jgi:hypothetical protein